MSAPLFAAIGDLIDALERFGIVSSDPRTGEPMQEQASPWDIAAAILAMPEMQAIRDVLKLVGAGHQEACCCVVCDLPASVREWLQS